MKKAIGIFLLVCFSAALLSSCGSRRGDNGCPNNFGSVEHSADHIG